MILRLENFEPNNSDLKKGFEIFERYFSFNTTVSLFGDEKDYIKFYPIFYIDSLKKN